MNSLKQYAVHYLEGTLASAFNGGVTAIVALLAMSTPPTVPAATHAFLVASIVHAFLYFNQHPLPVDAPTAPNQPAVQPNPPSNP